MLQLKLSAGTLSEQDIFDVSAGLIEPSNTPDNEVKASSTK